MSKASGISIILFICLIFSINLQSQIHSTSAGGDWDQQSTWVGGIVPGAGNDVVINGPVYTTSTSCQNLTINNNGAIYNDYYGYTLTVSGSVVNHGIISNYTSAFTVNIGGDITNNGTWSNSNTNLTGSADHNISSQNDHSFSGYQFSNTGTGNVYINSIAYFNNVIVNLNNYSLFLSANETLKMHNGYLVNFDIIGTDESSVVFGEGVFNSDAPYFASGSFTDIGFQGDINFGSSCSTYGTITNDGSLQNDYYGKTVMIYGDLINNGTIQNYVSSLIIRLYGNLTNNGTLANSLLRLDGDTDQTLTELNGNPINVSEFKSYKPSGKLEILTDIDFLNCNVWMDNDTMLVQNNSTLNFDGCEFLNTVLVANNASKNGNLKLNMNESSYISNCHVYNPEFLGIVKVKNNDFYGDILVTGTLENDFYGYTVNIHGNLTNNGIIKNYVSTLALNIEGDIINNGTWNNSYTTLTGTANQYVECLNSNTFSGYQFINNNATGDIYVNNFLYFDNVEIHFGYHDLILPSNTQLKIHDSFLHQCNVTGSGESSVIFGEGVYNIDAPYLQHSTFTDLSFEGEINIGNINSTHGTVYNNGSLQNNYYGYTFNLNDNFINNGIIKNWVSGLTLNLYGNYTNNGTMTNTALDFRGTTDQLVTQLNDNSFEQTYFTSFKPSGKIIALTDLTFNNVAIDLQHDTLIVPENSTISISSKYLYRSDIHAVSGGFNLFMENEAYIHDCKLTEISLFGNIDCNNANVFNGTTTNNGLFRNDYYSYILTVNGDFINNGTINSYVSSLVMNMYGNIENNGIWNNTTVGFYSTTDQEVSLADGMVFSPSYFYSYKPSGKIIALTDLSFDNVDINLEHDTLIMPDNSILSISGNRLYRSDIHAMSNRFNLYMDNNAYVHESNISDVTLFGTIDCNNGNIFNGTIVNEGLFRNDYYSYWVTINGDIINNNTVASYVSSFYINILGDLTNNGIWTNYYTQMNGTTDQYVHLKNGHWINGQMRFVSDISVAPYQWYWDSWAIENPPYPNPAIFGGQTSNTLTFLNPVSSSRTGTYKCWAGGNYSRDIIVDQVSSMRLDLTTLFEGPYNGTDMNTTINDLIPNHQPYNVYPWEYDGPEAAAGIPENAVDWLLVEVRDATDASLATSATSLGGQAAFILNDGSIVDLDGNSMLSFDYEIINQLFIVLWHRNHLPVMSQFALTAVDGIYSYDFTTAANKAYGNNQSSLGGDKFGMIGGNANGDGVINDFDGIESWIPQAGQTGYLSGDVNMDAQVNNQDKNEIWLPNYGKSEILP